MRRQLLTAVLLPLLLLPANAFARNHHGSNDRASFGSDITVAEGETVSDVACSFCSVHVHGNVNGDVAVFFGTVTVDADHKIGGDVAIFGGDLNLGEESSVGGDVAILGGNAHLHETAIIHGSRSIMPGTFWLLLPFIPFLVLIGIIWLIVYMVRRNRYRFPAYPQGRGIYPPPPPQR
jgi:hypothetical protein